jgi:ubiquinone/menaquinone biosynthesis C-methylase UbiE
MQQENFKPVSVKAPSSNKVLFYLRCMIDLQLNTIVRKLRPAMAKLDGKVLDVGAGESPWREWLLPAAEYCGIDVANAEEFGMHPPPQGVTYYDGIEIPFKDSSFNAAICIEVLEHVKDPDVLIAEIARCLKSDATLLLTVPWSARRHHIPYDYHRFTRERLLHLLEAHGFKGVEITERGSDISAIASKLIVLSLRLGPWHGFLRAIWTIPIFLMMIPITAIFLLSAHIADFLDLGAREDPLGYFVHAVRR